MKKLLYTLTIILLLSACSMDEKENYSKKDSISITVSTYPIEYIVNRVGGEYVTVQSILPPGTDAHTYEPTAKRIVEVANSDLFVFSGPEMEPYAKAIADSLENEAVQFISLNQAEAVFHQEESYMADEEHHDEEEDHDEESHVEDEDGHNHGDVDPHFWLDPKRMIIASEYIKTELSHRFPEKANTFHENFLSLKADLQELDNSFVTMLKDKTNRTIFVSHAAFGYWENEYGIKQLSIRGLSPTNEPSQKGLKELIHQVQDTHIPYVILEKNKNDRIATLLAEELELEILYIHNLASLSEQELKAGLDYLSIMKENIKVIDHALGR